jgi:hypothetical protein
MMAWGFLFDEMLKSEGSAEMEENMKKIGIILALFIGAFGVETRIHATETKEKPLVFEKLQIKDPQLKNIVAMTSLLPKGWKSESGVSWYPELYMSPTQIVIYLTEPESSAFYWYATPRVFGYDEMKPAIQKDESTRTEQTLVGGMIHRGAPRSAREIAEEAILGVPNITDLKIIKSEKPARYMNEINKILSLLINHLQGQVDKNFPGFGKYEHKMDAALVTCTFKKGDISMEAKVFAAISQSTYVLKAKTLDKNQKIVDVEARLIEWFPEVWALAAPKGELQKYENLYAVVMGNSHIELSWDKNQARFTAEVLKYMAEQRGATKITPAELFKKFAKVYDEKDPFDSIKAQIQVGEERAIANVLKEAVQSNGYYVPKGYKATGSNSDKKGKVVISKE